MLFIARKYKVPFSPICIVWGQLRFWEIASRELSAAGAGRAQASTASPVAMDCCVPDSWGFGPHSSPEWKGCSILVRWQTGKQSLRAASGNFWKINRGSSEPNVVYYKFIAVLPTALCLGFGLGFFFPSSSIYVHPCRILSVELGKERTSYWFCFKYAYEWVRVTFKTSIPWSLDVIKMRTLPRQCLSEGTLWALPRSVTVEEFAGCPMPDAGIFGEPLDLQAGVQKLQACPWIVCWSMSGFSSIPDS